MDQTAREFHQHANPRLLEELRALFGSFADRAEPLLRKVSEHEPGELPATCQWCPLCAAVAVVRGEQPELAVRAAEQGVVLVELLRALLGEPGAAPAPGAGSWTTSGQLPEDELVTTMPQPPVRERVQRIEVRRPGQWPAEDPDGDSDEPHREPDPAGPEGTAEPQARQPQGEPRSDDRGARVQRITVRRKGRGEGEQA